MCIKLENIIKLPGESDFKFHLALKNKEGIDPYNCYLEDWKKWLDWNSYKPRRNMFNRKYIFSLIPLTNNSTNESLHLFGGIFKVEETAKEGYKITLDDMYKNFIGRLIIRYNYNKRNRRINSEICYSKMEVYQILPLDNIIKSEINFPM